MQPNQTPHPTRIEASSPPKNLTLNASAPVEIQAAEGEGKRPTFSIFGYTGAVMRVGGFYTPVIVDLSGLKASSDNIPILRDHDAGRVIGQTDAVTIDAEGVRLSGSITGDDADAQNVIVHSKNGFKWQASIGASIIRSESLKAGETATVNGREVSGPLLIAREARLQETSFVAIGADGATAATVAASESLASDQEPDMTFDSWLKAKGFDPAALDETQKTSLKAMFDAEQGTNNNGASESRTVTASQPDGVKAQGSKDVTTAVAEIRAEQKRHSEIQAAVVKFSRERPAMLDVFEALGNQAIEAGWTPDQFELEARRKADELGIPGAIVKPGRNKAVNNRVVEAAVCMAGGLDNLEKSFDEQTLNAAYDNFRDGLGLRDLIAMAARENGYTSPTNTDVKGLLEAAFSTPSWGGRIQASGFSTLSLPGILSNTANKFLRLGFMAVEDGWRSISAVRAVRDFKQITTYSLTGGFEYEKVGASGELKHATVGELTYTNQAETYGKMFAITRRDIINDDLGALTQIPQRIGRGAALKINDVFWTEFMDNSTFFTSGRGNYFEGATVGTNDSRLGIEGLTRGETLFFNQTDPDGKPLGIMPQILLVPNALNATASQLMNSTEVRDTTANTLIGVSNPHAGKFTIVRSSYLSNSSYTGNSTTAWYLIANPAEMTVIEVVFLNGRDTPIVESADADFNTLGVQMRGYHDFGVAKMEYRGGVKAKGAA